MNTDDNINENTAENPDEQSTPVEGVATDRRPLGFWLRLVDRQLTEAFATEFEADGFARREWMVLNLLAGDVDDERLARLAERVAKHSHKGGGKLFRALAERGWIVETDGTWTLTDEGRAQRDVLKERVDAIRERVTAAVSPEDYATTVASLEAIAREFGWDGAERMPRGFGRRGFGPGRGFGAGFGPGRGFVAGFGGGFGPDFRAGFGYGHGRPDYGHARPSSGLQGDEHREHHGHRGCGPDGHGAPEHAHHGRHAHPGRRDGRKGERAYERGFEAGFAAASRVSHS